jgi:UDP-N-acetylglucosamine:LPS N-acetylglucosamine transferase
MESQSGQADTELVAAFLAKTAGRFASDEDVGKLLNPPVDGSTVGNWRRKIVKQEPVGLRPKNRLALQEYLFSGGPTGGDAFRDGVRAAIAELRARLQEMEERLG